MLHESLLAKNCYFTPPPAKAQVIDSKAYRKLIARSALPKENLQCGNLASDVMLEPRYEKEVLQVLGRANAICW